MFRFTNTPTSINIVQGTQDTMSVTLMGLVMVQCISHY